ncbi:uncharacterized protein [Dermacentor andersoni]|uniref:uncharacterized protein n=1 Tax=Dermacentor andersoni TaxID=34620 RepID=UPI003B3B3F8F
MGFGVPGGIEIHRLLQGSLSTISEETPSRKTPSSIALAAIPDAAKDDMSYAFSNLTIEDVLPDNRDLVLKPWYKVDERTCGSHTGPPRRLFPMAEWYQLVDIGVKDSVAECKTMQASVTMQGAWHQTVVASRFTMRLLLHSARDATTRAAEAAVTMSGQFVECDHVPSAEHSLDVFGCRLRIHPRDTLPCASTMLNAFKAESNGDTYGVAGPSSCIWRLHARLGCTSSSALLPLSGASYPRTCGSSNSSAPFVPVCPDHFSVTAAAFSATPAPLASATPAVFPAGRSYSDALRGRNNQTAAAEPSCGPPTAANSDPRDALIAALAAALRALLVQCPAINGNVRQMRVQYRHLHHGANEAGVQLLRQVTCRCDGEQEAAKPHSQPCGSGVYSAFEDDGAALAPSTMEAAGVIAEPLCVGSENY